MRLRVKVVTKAARDDILGWMGPENLKTLKIRVTAAPERGQANAAVEALLAKTLGIQKGRVRVVSGRTAPRKVIEVDGLNETEARQRLAR